jgi:hypothetical protein
MAEAKTLANREAEKATPRQRLYSMDCPITIAVVIS